MYVYIILLYSSCLLQILILINSYTAVLRIVDVHIFTYFNILIIFVFVSIMYVLYLMNFITIVANLKLEFVQVYKWNIFVILQSNRLWSNNPSWHPDTIKWPTHRKYDIPYYSTRHLWKLRIWIRKFICNCTVLSNTILVIKIRIKFISFFKICFFFLLCQIRSF